MFDYQDIATTHRYSVNCTEAMPVTQLELRLSMSLQRQGLQEQKEQLQQQLATVKENMQETHQRLQSAQQDEAAATRAVSKQMNVLKQKLQPTNMELPGNSKEAQQLVQQLQQAAEGQAKRQVHQKANAGM